MALFENRGLDESMVPVDAESGTWHYGLIARWWAEFNAAAPEELAYFRAAIRRFGEPALDLGCGRGRILMPLLAQGLRRWLRHLGRHDR